MTERNQMPEQQQLPTFEGLKVHVVALKLAGGGSGGPPQHIGDEVVIVCRAQVVGVNHVEKPNGVVTREHAAKVSEAWVIPEKMSPEQILADVVQLTRDATDGQGRLDDLEA